MTQKEVAISAMKALNIYKPYIKKFEKDGTVTLFERFGGYYINEQQEPELLRRIRAFEQANGSLVYAVTHEITEFGKLYDFLVISQYEDEWKDTLEDIKDNYAFAYVYNKDCEWLSEYGTIAVKSFGGGIARVG